MIWTTHMVTGATLAQILSANPLLALIAALFSHYLLDFLPHWDYEMKSQDPEINQRTNRLIFGPGLGLDAAKILIDLFSGLLIVLGYFYFLEVHLFPSMEISWWLIGAGMLLSITPDLINILYGFTGWKVFKPFLIWHNIWHCPPEPKNHKLNFGLIQQTGLIIILLAVTSVLI